MKKRILAFLGLILLTNVINIYAATPLRIALEKSLNPNYAPLIIAQQQGYFKAEGLEVTFLPQTPNAAKSVADGKADIATTYEPNFIKQIDQGLPLVTIGVLIDKPLDSLVGLKKNGIFALADLKGKRIGVHADGLSRAILQTMLAKQGFSLQDANIVTLTDHPGDALVSRKVDAVIDLARNREVSANQEEGIELTTFFPEEHGIPNYDELIFVTNRKDMHDTRWPRFLTAVRKAVHYLDEHPRETWLQFAKEYPAANTKANEEAWFATLPYFAEEPAILDQQEWANFAKFMYKNQLIKKIQPTANYLVTDETLAYTNEFPIIRKEQTKA